MAQFTLNFDDIQACIELASDGIEMHLHSQEKLDTIHKVMYAIAKASQQPNINRTLETKQQSQYTVQLNIQANIQLTTLKAQTNST